MSEPRDNSGWLNLIIGSVAKHAFKHPDCEDCKTITGLRYGRNEKEVVDLGARQE